MVEKGEDGLVFGGNVVLFFVVDILVVNGSNHILDANRVDGLLEFMLLPKEFVLILEGDDFLRIRILHDFGADVIGFGDEGAGETIVLGHQTHFGPDEEEGEISMVPTPLSGGEAARDGCELVGHLSNGAKVGLVDDVVEWVCFEFCPYHVGDGDHCCHGRHGGVGAVENINHLC